MPEETPFATIESAEEFLALLLSEIQSTKDDMVALAEAESGDNPRRLEALRLVIHKLNQLDSNTSSNLRILGDLRMLRSLLTR